EGARLGVGLASSSARLRDLDCRRADHCVNSSAGSDVEVLRAWLEEAAIGVDIQAGVTARLLDISARTGVEGGGGAISTSGEVELRRADLSGFYGFGLGVHGGHIEASDLDIDDIKPTVEGSGMAIFAQTQTSGRIERARLFGRTDRSTFVSYGRDYRIADVSIESSPGLGHAGIENWGGPMTLDRVSIVVGNFGVLASASPEQGESGSTTANDLEIASTRRAGVVVFHDGRATVSRVWIHDAAGAGVVSTDNSSVAASDVRVSRVEVGMYGGGVVVAGNGRATLARFVVEDSVIGLAFAGSIEGARVASLQPSDGVVRGNRIGLELRGIVQDLRQYLGKVRYEANGATFVMPE
ncbi:MAG: hypothetical protein HYZ27_09885, partial [Deltaproteobacteria bacterium]|nr:hypothetical protein [Deltaproteobacteria bacterium]